MKFKNIKNKRFFVIAITLILSGLGLSVAPGAVESVAAIACEIVTCGE